MGFRGSEVQTQDEKVHDNRHEGQGGKGSHRSHAKTGFGAQETTSVFAVRKLLFLVSNVFLQFSRDRTVMVLCRVLFSQYAVRTRAIQSPLESFLHLGKAECVLD